jgi:hypothetical protein
MTVTTTTLTTHSRTPIRSNGGRPDPWNPSPEATGTSLVVTTVLLGRPLLPALLVLLGAVTGCVPTTARDDARLMSALTEKVARKGQQFAAFRQSLAEARQRNIDALERNALASEQTVQHTQSLWTIGNLNDQLKAYRDVQTAMDLSAKQREASVKLREEQAAALDAVHTGVNLRTDNLAATSQALARLAEEPDLETQVKFLIGFGRAVQKSLKEAEEQAKAQSQAGEKEADNKAKDLKADAKLITKARSARPPATNPAPPPQ